MRVSGFLVSCAIFVLVLLAAVFVVSSQESGYFLDDVAADFNQGNYDNTRTDGENVTLGYNYSAPADWWDSSWSYRKPITITENSGSDLTDYVINLTISHVSGKMNPDFSDIRFVDSDGNVLNYWIEDYTASSASVWVKVASIPTSGAVIYMYYGNPSAGSASSGADTFEFFDDFSTDISDYTNVWTGAGGGSCTFTWNSGSEWVDISCSNAASSILVHNSFSIVDGLVEHNTRITGGADNIRIWNVMRYQSSGTYYEGRYTEESFYLGDSPVIRKVVSGWPNIIATATGIMLSKNVWYRLGFAVWGNNLASFRDGVRDLVGTDGSITSSGKIGVQPDEMVGNLDNLRVRKYASPEPASSFGVEEGYYYSAYVGSGNFTSRVFDAGGVANWTKMGWGQTLPVGAEGAFYDSQCDSSTGGCDGDENPSTDPSLIALWHLNNNLADSSGNGHNGAAAGGLDCTGDVGKFNNACWFDGNDDRIEIPYTSDFDFSTKDFTIEAWVNLTDNDDMQFIFGEQAWSTYPEFMVIWMEVDTRYAANQIEFLISNGTQNFRAYWYSSNEVVDNGWHHIVGKREGQMIYLYVDGVEKDSETFTGNVNSPAIAQPKISIGSLWKGDWCCRARGTIDEVAVYERALPAGEILAHYRNGTAYRSQSDAFGDGSDGAVTVSGTQVVNTYAYVTDVSLPAGGTTINVNDGSGFSAGDEVLVVGMQGTYAGNYEFVNVQSVNGNQLVLSSGLGNSYTSGTFDVQNAQATQVVRVPQYTDVRVTEDNGEITASAWNGYVGGIVVFRAAGTVGVEGEIDVSGLGFRGGDGNVGGDPGNGWQGESYRGRGSVSGSANYGGGGGGMCGSCGSNTADAGGGGGGHATAGTSGSGRGGAVGGSGGSSYGNDNLSVAMFFGSGGGESEIWSGANPRQFGGDGGGIIMVFANTINVAGSVLGDGKAGGETSGGAGGSVFIKYASGSFSGTVSASGADGNCHAPGACGGNGGDGRVGMEHVDVPEAGITSINMYARSCDDAACSGESWSGPYSGGFVILDVSDNQYFQYRAVLATTDTNITPYLEYVNVSYTAAEGPAVVAMGTLPEYANTKNISVSWSGSGGFSGIKCYDVQYHTGGGAWTAWKTCTTSNQDVFGPANPVNVTDGVTYYFRARATDNTDVVGEWSSAVNTTVDSIMPGVALVARDQDGNVLERVTEALGVSEVTLSMNASDSVSGIGNSTLKYWITQRDSLESREESCGSAGAGALVTCSVTIPYGEGVIIKYQAEATDRAGNLKVLGPMWISGHQLANFVVHNISLVLGDVTFVKVQVRNMQAEFDNITLSFSPTTYGFASFLDAEGANLSLDRRALTIGLNSYEDAEVFAKLYSSETGIYNLELGASSGLNPNVTDYDIMGINIDYSPSFSGLDLLWVILLLTASVLVYAGFAGGRRV